HLLQPLKANLICCPAIGAICKLPGWTKIRLLIPRSLMFFPFQDDHWWYGNPFCVDAFNDSNPFTVALDNYQRSLTAFYCSNYLRCCTESNCKASFIKIPDVIFMHSMFLNSCMYSLKPLI